MIFIYNYLGINFKYAKESNYEHYGDMFKKFSLHPRTFSTIDWRLDAEIEESSLKDSNANGTLICDIDMFKINTFKFHIW